VQLLLNAAEFAHDATILKICEAEWDFSLNLNVKSMHRTIHAFLPTIRSPARVPSSTSPRSPPISCPEAFAAIAFALATSMLERAATASPHGRALFICRQRMGGSDPRRKLQHSPALRRSETPTQRAHGQDHRRMTRAVIYARFSTELQNEKSTEDQIALCRAYANRQKIDVIATFEDRARSGASVFGRDGLMQLMDAARQRLFDVVIVEALDRLSRASFVRTPSVRLLRLWHVGARP